MLTIEIVDLCGKCELQKGEDVKTIWNILRALINAPDAIHWIKKYESAKAQNECLSKQIEILQKKNIDMLKHIKKLKGKK